MKGNLSTRMAPALLLVLLVIGSAAQAAEADTFVGGMAAWSIVGAPTESTLNMSPVGVTTFHNNLDVAVLGIVIMVLRNNLGQAVYFSTATMNVTRGMSSTAYNVEFGVTPGIYNATYFVIATTGVAISNSTTAPFSAR
jgi:hypothetical protein